MTVIQDKIKAMEEVQNNLPDLVLDQIKNYETEILGLNTDDQLFQKGVDSQEKRIEPGYTPFTVSIKRQKGQPINRVTLKDTGDFHKSFAVEYFPDSFAIVADDPKTKKIEKKYGKDVTGLTDENIQEVIEIVRGDLIEDFNKRIA